MQDSFIDVVVVILSCSTWLCLLHFNLGLGLSSYYMWNCCVSCKRIWEIYERFLIICLSMHLQDIQNGPLGGFILEYDAPLSQDVVLRRKFESGDEIAVSAMLGQETFAREGIFPREVLMKVCVKKQGLSSILQFDCGVSEMDNGRSEFDIHNACYLESAYCPCPSVYRGPLFRFFFFFYVCFKQN